MASIPAPRKQQEKRRHFPQVDLAEISLIEWPADALRSPRLLGRLRDDDLVTEVAERLKERAEFLEQYVSLTPDIDGGGDPQ